MPRPGPLRHIDETVEESRSRLVCQQHIRIAVHHQRLKRLMLTKNTLQGFNDALHLPRIPGMLGIGGSVTGAQQQQVPVAQGHIQHLGYLHKRLGARHAPARFHIGRRLVMGLDPIGA